MHAQSAAFHGKIVGVQASSVMGAN